MSTAETQTKTRRTAPPSWYEPLDFVLVRAPLLPVESYSNLRAAEGHGLVPSQPGSLLPRDPLIRRALAVGSVALSDALAHSSDTDPKASHHLGSLLRYLIRMSTRPTPYGMFAGVALGRWGSKTTLALAPARPRTRTRPDMEWLYRMVSELEARPGVRRHLRLVANSCAFVRGGRVWLPEKAFGGNETPLSVRATRMVEQALSAARLPIPWQALFACLREAAPDAPSEKIEKLIDELCSQTLLLTDLRPALTMPEPARYVAERLFEIPGAEDRIKELRWLLDWCDGWDRQPDDEASAAYCAMAARTGMASRPAVQVDMAIETAGREINRAVGREAARAAELLLRLSPLPSGASYWTAYRNAFHVRYGVNREVPVLELLDGSFGLGQPWNYSANTAISPSKATQRASTLMNFALDALHTHNRTIELDDEAIEELSTSPQNAKSGPVSMDLYAFVAAHSAAAMDDGDFQIIIGPNLGSMAAGRNLGRFADLLGADAVNALSQAAREEERRAPGRIWAELVYEPRQGHAANVVVRPAIRSHEIVLGAVSGVDGDRVIPVNELSVSVMEDRFRLTWSKTGEEVIVCAGHMLNNLRAPAVVRFLAELSHEGETSLSGFDWGPASTLPFLPRVCSGRVVLRPAEWRIDASTRSRDLASGERGLFAEALPKWRSKWGVPRHIYLSSGDNRLLLDLEDAWQTEELRCEIDRMSAGGAVILQEALPDLSENWLRGADGAHVTELVISLIRRDGGRAARHTEAVQPPEVRAASQTIIPWSERLRPPGSDWLFIKLYGPRNLQDSLIAGSLFEFAEQARVSKLADSWFFLRYSDPDPHVRLRFHGDPSRLSRELMPWTCEWASGLMEKGSCLRFAFDTYDREIERYGGTAAIETAESLFAADSKAAAAILAMFEQGMLRADRFLIKLVSLDGLLSDLGLDPLQRLEWYRQPGFSKRETSEEYRRLKNMLRAYLGTDRYWFAQPGGGRLHEIFRERRSAVEPLGARLAELEKSRALSLPPSAIYRSLVHLHLNRLMGAEAASERRILGLLMRTRESLAHSPVVPRFTV
jgi:thiopeptide-type bacteriocin biosynthesis protein